MVLDGVFGLMADEAVDKAVWEVHAELCAVSRRMLAVVAEHDRRNLWQLTGSKSEAAHLGVVLGLTWRTANQWVRVAHAIDREPRWGAAFASGDLCLDKLAELVSLAEAEQPGVCAPLGPFDDPPPDPGAGGADPSGSADPDGGAVDGTGGEPAGDPSADTDPSVGADSSAGTDGSGGEGADPSADPDGSGGGGCSVEDLLALAGRLSPAQLSRMARRARRKSAEEADRLHRRRRVNARRDEQSGGVWLDGVLFDDDAATFTAAVDAYLATTGTNPATGHYDPLDVRVADAVLDMARAYLGAKGGDPRPTVVVHADARILLGEDGWAETTGWTALSAETVRRLACFCKLGMIADGPDGAPIGVGRARRIAPPWVAENVRHRDGGCRMCGRPLFTQIHHIIPWEPPFNGRTDLDSLCELCYEHHHLVHEGGWRIEGHPDRELRFISPTGRIITSYPACPPTTTPPPSRRTTPPGTHPPRPDRG